MRPSIYPFLTLALAACGPAPGAPDDPDPTGTTTGTTTADPTPTTTTPDDDPTPTTTTAPDEPSAVHPQESDWLPVVDALPFPADITTLTVGRPEFNGNFASRGKVEVWLDHDEPTISVEMRVYDFSDDPTFLGDSNSPGTLARTRLWAFTGDADPQPPIAMPPEADCTIGAWKDNCKLTAYYDGKFQPARHGADFIVHLPRSYRGELHVFADDNLAEASYPRLGDVLVDGLCSSGTVSLAQGSARVRLCDELSPAPTCPPDQVAACDDFVDGEGDDAAWSPACPCSPALFGNLLVESRPPFAANITVVTPATTWINARATNETGSPDLACSATISGCLPDTCTTAPQPFGAAAEFNLPGPAAPSGGGFNITARTAGCAPVEFFASPQLWQDKDTPPMSEQHGRVDICTDC